MRQGSAPAAVVQGWIRLSLLLRKEDGRHSGAPCGSSVSSGSRPAVGSLPSVRFALSLGLRFDNDNCRLAGLHPVLIWLLPPVGARLRYRADPVRRGHFRAEVWVGRESEEALIIPRVVKLLIFQKELRLIFRNDPLHDELSGLVKMFDDAAHRFGIQVCALNLPRSPRRRLRHRKQFRFNKSTNRGVAHTAMARRLRQPEDLPSSLIVRTSASNCMFPPDICHA